MTSDMNVYNHILDTLQIAKHILTRCDPPSYGNLTNDICPSELARKICFYTGVDRKHIDQLLTNLKDKKTFLDWLKFKEITYETSLYLFSLSFQRIRKVIIDQYVNKLKIPTKASILKAMLINKENDLYTLPLLNQDLNILGYIWKKLPNSDKYIVVENTKQVANRMKFLQEMELYRKNNRALIHIDGTSRWPWHTRNKEIIAVASPQLGFIDAYLSPELRSLYNWLRDKLHTLPQNLVFVIQQSNRPGSDFEPTCELPTIHSKKAKMMAWLDTYNIPYDETLHRGELFALIEKYKVHCPPVYKICEILKAAGHDVILRPPELSYEGYFKRITKLCFEKKNMTLPEFKTYLSTTMNNTLLEFWLGEDGRMAAEEQRIYEEELKLELILDNLMEAMKNKTLSASDLDECEDDEFDREFFNNVIFDALPMVPKKLAAVQLEAQSQEPLALGTSETQPGPSNR